MYTLDSLNKLSEIKENKDIKSLSHAIFPGTHCPLFGVALTASYVKNMVLIVIGTSECTYYAKNFSYHRQKGKDRVYSLVLNDNEIIMGAVYEVEQAVRDIIEIENPEAVMLVSTCVPEVIGEDYFGIQYSLGSEIDIPIFIVQTEHFKCNSHIPGMTRSLLALTTAMEKQTPNNSINVLGHRFENVEETELIKLLKNYHIEINTVIPSNCSIEEIRQAPQAKLNIVTDMVALDLALQMESKFGTPYIYFDKHMQKEVIAKNYKKLEKIFGINFEAALQKVKNEYDKLYVECQSLLRDKKFIYGNTPMMAFETAQFLTTLGMQPLLIQVRELYEQDIPYKDAILAAGFNPPISRIANIAPLRDLYGVIGADLYVGHESPMILREHGMIQMTFDSHAQKIGYELPVGMMKDIIKAFNGEPTGMMAAMMVRNKKPGRKGHPSSMPPHGMKKAEKGGHPYGSQ